MGFSERIDTILNTSQACGVFFFSFSSMWGMPWGALFQWGGDKKVIADRCMPVTSACSRSFLLTLISAVVVSR